MLTHRTSVRVLCVIPQNRTNSIRNVACEFVYAESPIETFSIGDSAQLNNITLPVPYRVIVLTCGMTDTGQTLVNLYIESNNFTIHFYRQNVIFGTVDNFFVYFLYGILHITVKYFEEI